MKEYIVRKIAENSSICRCGSGFIVGHYLITAGHMWLKDSTEYILFNGNAVSLDSPIFLEDWGHQPDKLDLAIYHLPTINSPLTLSDIDVTINMELKSQCFQFQSVDSTSFVECTIGVTQKYEKYFGGISSKLLHKTSSGSPVFCKEKVVGMLVAGNDDNGVPKSPNSPHNFCQFLSSKTILDVMNKIR